MINTFAEEYKLPFTWEAKKTTGTSEVEVKKAEIDHKEDRALASEDDLIEEDSSEARLWKFEQDDPK